jgi:hypothetical protein
MATPAAGREAVAHLRLAHEVSGGRTYSTFGADRTFIRCSTIRPGRYHRRARLRELVAFAGGLGYRRLSGVCPWNAKTAAFPSAIESSLMAAKTPKIYHIFQLLRNFTAIKLLRQELPGNHRAVKKKPYDELTIVDSWLCVRTH